MGLDELGLINVKAAAFGATGNGSTNDTAAVQAAIDATPNDGVVYFPPGSYSVNQLNVPHARAIKFQGASPWATTLIVSALPIQAGQRFKTGSTGCISIKILALGSIPAPAAKI